MRHLMQNAIAHLSVISLLAAQLSPAMAEVTSPNPASLAASAVPGKTFSRRDYRACQTGDENQFRNAIRALTLKALREGTQSLDYDAIVRKHWRTSNLTKIVDDQVDVAVRQVREETTWSRLISSLAFRSEAQEIARAVAERVYRSDALKKGIEALALKVGQEIGASIEITTEDAARPTQRCLEAYLGPRYGRTVARTVNENADSAFRVDPKSNQAQVSTGSVLIQTSEGIAGVVLLLVRRQMARMAQRLGQRLVGSILGRLVSVVAGGIGLVLIAKDVWELRNGILPIIEEEMKSESSKAKVRQELAKSIKEQITGHMDELAERTADHVIDIWHDFRRAHAKVVQLAVKEPDFKAFLDLVRPTQLPRVDEIVGLIIVSEGDDAVMNRLRDGTLQRAVNELKPSGLQIAREKQSLATGLSWQSLADGELGRVLSLGLHKRANPDSFSRESLGRILALPDPLAIKRIAAVDRPTRDVLFELDNPRLIKLARGLDPSALSSIAKYIGTLETAAGQRLMNIVSQDPAKMRHLTSDRVRDAILSSRDQTTAVGMMLNEPLTVDVARFFIDGQRVMDGDVHWLLLWEKHPVALVIIGIFTLLLLLILRRLIFGGRRARA